MVHLNFFGFVVYIIQHKSQEDISPLCGVTIVLSVSGSTGKSAPSIMSRLSVSDLCLQVIIYRYSCCVSSVGKSLSTLGVLLNGNYYSEFLMLLALQ